MTGTIVYAVMLLLILFMKLLMGSLDTDEKRKRFLFMSAILIIFVVGSRFAPLNRGTDMFNYYNYYAFAGRVPFNELYFRDVGYNYLTWFLTRIVPWPQFVMYFVAAVTTWLTLRFIYLNCKDVFLGLLLFLSMGTFLFYLRGFRQALAMSLCLVAFEYVKEKKLIKFIVVTLIAVSMHRSAVVFLPFYFLGNRKAKAWNNVVTLVGFIAMIFFLQDVLDFGNDLLEKSYAMRNPSQSLIGPIINITVFTAAIILGWSQARSAKGGSENRSTAVMMQMLIIGLCIYVLRFQSLAMERTSFYFLPAVITLLPESIAGMKNENNRKYINTMAVVFCVALFLWRNTATDLIYGFFWMY